MELVCPAGNFPALKAAVDAGADAVYIGFRDDTNARHFAGLNFTLRTIDKALQYTQAKGCKLFLAINTYPQPQGWGRWQQAVDIAAEKGVSALIVADMGVMAYAAKQYPSLPLHLSVQGSATNPSALQFYRQQFNIRRAVLPRVLSLKQVEQVAQATDVDLEVFGFGSLCVMVEGRCLLSSYVTGESPNTKGACSPAHAVRWEQTPKGLESRLNGVLVERYEHNENAGYPVICKGRFDVAGSRYHAFEEPTSLNTLEILPQLYRMGIKAIKLEGRQRSPAYVAQVASVWRKAIDQCCQSPDGFTPDKQGMATLAQVSEGHQTTLGAYNRPWQ